MTANFRVFPPSPTTLTIKDSGQEISITREVPNLDDMLILMEDALLACGYELKGHLTIEVKNG